MLRHRLLSPASCHCFLPVGPASSQSNIKQAAENQEQVARSRAALERDEVELIEYRELFPALRRQELLTSFSQANPFAASDRQTALDEEGRSLDELAATLTADLAAMRAELGEDAVAIAQDTRERRSDRRSRRRRR